MKDGVLPLLGDSALIRRLRVRHHHADLSAEMFLVEAEGFGACAGEVHVCGQSHRTPFFTPGAPGPRSHSAGAPSPRSVFTPGAPAPRSHSAGAPSPRSVFTPGAPAPRWPLFHLH